MSDTPLACLILAGGLGTRMKSAVPKVLHEACGRTLLEWSLDATQGLGADSVTVVVPPGSERIEQLVPGWAQCAVQETPRGTGDAVAAARSMLEGFDGDVLVLYADTPLVDSETLDGLLEAHRAAGSAAAVLTIERSGMRMLDFGRILRDEQGDVRGIVEARDATPQEYELSEVNSGIAVFRSGLLWPALERLTPQNDQGELYLTDVVGLLVGDGEQVVAHRHADATVAQGINTRADLADAAAELRRRINRAHMLAGVTIVDPQTTLIDAAVEIEADATIEPFTVLRGATRVEQGAVVGPHVVAVDAVIGAGASVGPFCYLRPGTELRAGSKAGTYVEIKNTVLGEGAKVPHLSYIGDAEIGSGTNIGANAITANYDGQTKHRTVIGENVRTGSQNVFVAPVTIGDGAWTAAGSAITDDIPPDALGVARAKQTNIENYARRRRPQS
jgi:bifunctional UDP-N-acetylglucosamine pyrophosphorylase / glucosamine-1-phosphate N-acetyltransferase